MNCEKIRALIMNGYIDDALNDSERAMVKEHLAGCPLCTSFEVKIRSVSTEPFKGMKPVEPPERVWKTIAGRIKETPRYGEIPLYRREKRGVAFYFPKPVFLAATLAMALLVVAIFMHYQYSEQRSLGLYIEEEMGYIASSSGANTTTDDEMLSDMDIFNQSMS